MAQSVRTIDAYELNPMNDINRGFTKCYFFESGQELGVTTHELFGLPGELRI